jgi:alkyl sulfatase BDS1-like metallo-beta-lactamase superfamily hydrolase
MREIELPTKLRVGQGYGKVTWAVRTLWETYVGWFQLRSTTEMYPDSSGAALAELVAAAGIDAAVERAEAALARGDAVVAIRVAEAVEEQVPDDPRARAVLAAAHRFLLDHGGDVSFWENGWLHYELDRLGVD